jgi:hypothetical protein
MPPVIAEAIAKYHSQTVLSANVTVADMLAARKDLAVIQKVCIGIQIQSFS